MLIKGEQLPLPFEEGLDPLYEELLAWEEKETQEILDALTELDGDAIVEETLE